MSSTKGTKGKITILQEDRKYKTLNSIQKENNYYKIVQNFIEIAKLLLSNYSLYEDKQKIYDEITSIIEEDKDNQKQLLIYFLLLLIYSISIRPKQADIFCFLISKLLLNFPEKRTILLDNISFNKICEDYSFANEVLKLHGFYDHDYETKKETVLSLYNEESLGYNLIEDNIKYLQDYVNSNYSEAKEIVLRVNRRCPLNGILKIPIQWRACPGDLKTKDINLLDYCCFFGSIKCFKFLKINGFEPGKYIQGMSISGGNLEIIHDIEQMGFSFDYCYEYSIQYHHRAINEWLLSNYKCELISLTNCIKFLNYEAFLFMLLNGVDVNEGTIQPLAYLCQQNYVNVGLIKLLIENGADVNRITKKDYEATLTPLAFLCCQKNPNLDAIKFLIENGANVNIGKAIPLGCLCNQCTIDLLAIKLLIENGADVNKMHNGMLTPLCCLCDNFTLNVDAIKLLIENGADVNKICKECNKTFTVLGLICRWITFIKSDTLVVIKLLIENGADVNIPTCESNGDTCTPLFYLCAACNYDAIKLLIENGADVNKGTEKPLSCLYPRRNKYPDAYKLLKEHGAHLY